MGQEIPVTEQTPDEFVNQPLPRFDAQEFDNSLYTNAYNAYLEKAIKCPCTLKSNGSALPECRNCGGVGWTWINKRKTVIMMQGINRPTKFQNWSEEDRGTVSISARDEDRLSFMDRVTLLDLSAGYTEVRKTEDFAGRKLLGLTYYPVEIEYVFLFEEYNKKYIPLVYGTDYNIDGYHLEIIGQYKSRKEMSIAVRYMHNPQYCIIDIIREQSASRGSVDQPCGEKDPNALGKHPVHSIGRKLHYLFDKPNGYGVSLLDNTTNQEPVVSYDYPVFPPALPPTLTCDNLASCSTFQSLQTLVATLQTAQGLHENDFSNPHQVTAVQTGAPTVAQAQGYANTAETNAKNYADSKDVIVLSTANTNAQGYANTAETNANQYSYDLQCNSILVRTTKANHTGVTAQTSIYTGLLIPANTIQANDIIRVHICWGATSNANNKTLRFHFNTIDSLFGAIQQAAHSVTTNNQYTSTVRNIIVESQTVQRKFLPTTSFANDESAGSAASTGVTTSSVDFSVDQYLIVSLQLAVATDQSRINSVKLTIYRES